MRGTSSRTSFRILGDFDPDHITGLLDTAPTRVHRKGEKDKSGTPFEHDGWFLSTGPPNAASVELQFLELTRLLLGKSEINKTLCKRYSVDVFCGITSEEQGGFGLSTQALRIFSEFGIGLEVSLILFDG